MTRPLPTPVDQALAAAVRAPSPHNTQPWCFRVGPDRVELRLDRDRVLRVADPDGREARLSCGAALLNLTITLAANGIHARIRLVPAAGDPDLLAVVELAGNHHASPEERELAEAVYRRHTNRRPYLDRPVPEASRARLSRAAQTAGGRLDFLDQPSRYEAVASLVRQAEMVHGTDSRYAAEAARWTGRDVASPDGVPTVSAAPPALEDQFVPQRGSHANPDLPARAYERQPLLAAVLTGGEGPRADLRGGMVMQRVLLTATALGLASSFVSQPFETPDTRTELDRIFGDAGTVHTLLRLGYGYPVRMTSRRPAADVARPIPELP
ncbi:Acg family FMN-binding oxidoreductase [Amycolatopsis suaedae]|uniref:Nitroreductase n=1 Tax=Amycolatopsis suaedae TaxID=2510978 RepID=A0A4Q7JDG6_9PSEU|nr:nitroreductase family protein [Amycolatopsis suaedae]RZQ65930.1 hypothetical protein EWH70_02325 [Amycolatopsis suaedae]